MTDYKAFLSRYESFEACRISRGYAEKRLAANKNRAARRILERLKRCRKGSRCFSGVCPVCARQFRLRWLPQAEDVLGDNQPCIQLCWTPPRAAFASGMLADFDLNDLIEKQQNALMEAVPDAVAVGGIDVSLKFHSDGERSWRIASRVLIDQPIDQHTIEHLSRAHSPHSPYYYSLDIRTATSTPSTLSSAFKHRIFFTQYNLDKPFGGRLTFNPLPRPYAHEADLFQARWPLWDRLILHNVTAGKDPYRPALRRRT